MEDCAKVSYEQPEQLWEQYQRHRTVENKNKLVMHYIFLVRSIASRLMPLYSAHTHYDDLIGYGVIGLIDAVEKYVPERGIRFDLYAAKRIRGEIIDNMRKQDWASTSLRSRIKQIAQAYDALGCEQDDAGEEKVAQMLGLDVQQVRSALEKAYMFNVVHFESMLNNGGLSMENLLPESEEDGPQRQLEQQEFKEVLRKAIEHLSPSEKQIITLYYYEELMLKDIASLMKVTPARVSQIHSRALLKIRLELERYIRGSD